MTSLRGLGRRALIGLAVLSLAACSDKGAGDVAGPSGGGNPTPPSISAADVAYCYTETNRFRAMTSARPVVADSNVEAYAQQAAESDHRTGQAHGHTRGPSGPAGSYGENEVVRWPHTVGARDLITGAMAAFYNEGPGAGHYENLRNPGWGRVGCGLVLSNGAFTLVQHFRP